MPAKNGKSSKAASSKIVRDKAGIVQKFDGSEFGGEDTHIVHAAPIGRELFTVGVSTYKGRTTLDFRRYYRNEDDVWMPTPKGVGVGTDDVKFLFSALSDNRKLVEKLMADKAK